MNKKFTNREFNALINEMLRIAKTITNKTRNSCSVSLNKDNVLLCIQGDERERELCYQMCSFRA